MTPFFNESTYMCIFPIIICLIMQLVVPFPLQKIRKVSLSWRVISLFLSILYILMTSITEVIKDDFSLPAKCILLLVSLFSCFLLLIRAGSSEIRSFQHSFRKIGRTPIYTVMIPITLLTLFIISGCYPGVFSSDSASSWTDVAANSFSDWHPCYLPVYSKGHTANFRQSLSSGAASGLFMDRSELLCALTPRKICVLLNMRISYTP